MALPIRSLSLTSYLYSLLPNCPDFSRPASEKNEVGTVGYKATHAPYSPACFNSASKKVLDECLTHRVALSPGFIPYI